MRKFISVLFALVLVLSLSLVTATPVAAAPDTLNVHPLTLGTKNTDSIAQWSTTQFKNGSYSASLDTGTTTQGDGDEARIEITMPSGTTLNDITSISWWVYAVTGYPPHLDITLDCDGDDVVDNEDMLTAEMNLNCVGAPKSIATLQGEISYNTGWVQTFELTSDDGFGAITDTTIFWVTKMGSGDLNAPSGTLAQWKAGTVANDPESEMTTPVITGSAPVKKLEIEVDNWVANSDVYVDDVAINGVVWYGLIQDAIDSASADDTISVAAGTYNENLVIATENITVQAASSPVIDGGGTLGPGVHITAADVTFQGFTITNFTCTPTAGIGAMLVEGDGAVIDDNIIYDITSSEAEPAGIGIDVHASNVEVTNNTVHDVGSIGIRVRHDWDTAPTVSNNVLLENNEVYRTANSGVLVTGYAKGVTVRENEIYESLEPTEYSLFVHYGAEDVLIENNIIRDPYDSIYGHNVVLAGCDNVTISGNTITGATSGKNIYLLSDYAPWVDTELLSTNVNIINNDIQNGKWGVRIANAGATDASQMAATTTINLNNISGNTEYGVENAIATSVDAENNWWGNASGPVLAGTAYTSYGDAVSADVDYDPWLLAEVEIGVTPTTFQNTLALKDGWTLVSTDKEVTTDSDWTATVAYKYTVGSGYTQVDMATQLTSVDAYYLKTSGGGGVGINYSTAAPGVVTKSLGAGWNTISCAALTDAYVLLSQLRTVQIGDQVDAGVTNLGGQGSYNQFTDSFSVPLATAGDWTQISGTGTPITLNAFDGFWVYMNAGKSFGVIPD